jgi:hypothetical protein
MQSIITQKRDERSDKSVIHNILFVVQQIMILFLYFIGWNSSQIIHASTNIDINLWDVMSTNEFAVNEGKYMSFFITKKY